MTTFAAVEFRCWHVAQTSQHAVAGFSFFFSVIFVTVETATYLSDAGFVSFSTIVAGIDELSFLPVLGGFLRATKSASFTAKSLTVTGKPLYALYHLKPFVR